MNLAQLIDPERVQRGLTEERRSQRAACPPMGHVVHAVEMRSGGSLDGHAVEALPAGYGVNRTRQVLAAAAGRLSATDIFDVVDELEIGQIHGALGQLYAKGEIERDGVKGAYRYALTERGRAALSEPEAAVALSTATKAEPAAASASVPPATRSRHHGPCTMESVLPLLAGSPDGALNSELQKYLALKSAGERNLLTSCLAYLVRKELATKRGDSRPHVYAISDAGRAWMRQRNLKPRIVVLP